MKVQFIGNMPPILLGGAGVALIGMTLMNMLAPDQFHFPVTALAGPWLLWELCG